MGTNDSVRLHRRRIRPSWGILALCGVLALAACAGDSPDEGPGPIGPVGPVGSVGPVGDDETGLPGSGEITTETRTIDSFDRLVFSSEGTVIVTQAATASLSIEADENLHEYLEAEVADGELVISTAGDVDLAPSRSITFRVGVVDLSGMELAGAGAITAEELSVTALAVLLSGTGEITVDQLQAEQVTVGHGGVGTIRLVGMADEQHVEVAGVGAFDGGGLAGRSGRVKASGTGTAIVWITDDLTLVVSESGSVQFYGSPAVTEEISDLGTATPLGNK